MSCPVCGAPIVRYEDNGEEACAADPAHLEDYEEPSSCEDLCMEQCVGACGVFSETVISAEAFDAFVAWLDAAHLEDFGQNDRP